MELTGNNIIGSKFMKTNNMTFRAIDPVSGQELDPLFHQASLSEINNAMEKAEEAFGANRSKSGEDKARLLKHIVREIELLGDQLVERVCAETGLSAERVRGERQRTVDQLIMFADLVREGSWINARLDGNIRRMLIPIGPVVVFGASNFPLAFSVAGGDTASALAAGCPVVVKAHPAHPGTSELVARAIQSAVASSGFHEGTFSMVHGRNYGISIDLVTHSLTRAVGFTGSVQAGRAIFDAAASRPSPIPVFAEMGSVNPVFILPEALRKRPGQIAKELVESVTLGAGQFCTNPGLVFGIRGEAMNAFLAEITTLLENTSTFTMLHEGICSAYNQSIRTVSKIEGVEIVSDARSDSTESGSKAGAHVFTTDQNTFLNNSQLSEEIFGPSTLIVQVASEESFETIAHNLNGNLTASLHGMDEEIQEYSHLIEKLKNRVGRLIFNDFPTGVKVCASMHHGGPYPATTDVRSTSVGTAAIERFTRPICYQNFPESALPLELQNENKLRIWRLIEGQLTKDNYQLT